MFKKQKEIFFITLLFFGFLILTPNFALGQASSVNFYVDPGYDFSSRSQAEGFLKKTTQNAYFYFEKDWYSNLTDGERLQADTMLEELALDFDSLIYPKLSSAFGSEWKPGIDNDNKITIFFEKLKDNAAGYMRTNDEFLKQQADTSNVREMIYINSQFLFQKLVKSLVAHEFAHLIEYNQKERISGMQDETWLSEVRAELAPTIVGYDSLDFQNSNLQRRIKTFLENPNNSLTQWENITADYGIVSIFGQYIYEQYGVKTLGDTLLTKQKGILALEEAIKKNGFDKSFTDVFSDFTIALLFNDCFLGANYCFSNPNLKTLKVAPLLIFVPNTNDTELSLKYQSTYYSPNWFRITSFGQSNLSLDFSGDLSAKFKVPYILCSSGLTNCQISNLLLNSLNTGKITIPDFGKQYQILMIFPLIQDILGENTGQRQVFNFNFLFKAQIVNPSLSTNSDESNIEALKARIKELQTQVEVLKAKLLGDSATYPQLCGIITIDLRYGQSGNDVKCMQVFLKNQGAGIYPSGLVTGYFGSLTKLAVVRFQEKYKSEILLPAGLSAGNGFVGPITRKKINELLKK